MKIAIVIACFALAVPAWAQTSSSAESAAIEKLHADWIAAWNAHQADGLAALFTDSGDLINPAGRAAKGRAQIARLFADEHAGRLKDSTFSTSCEAPRHLASDVVAVDCDYTVEGLKDPSVPSGTVRGHLTDVLVRSGTAWKIALHRAMRPIPMGNQQRPEARTPPPLPR